jgi:hypothetical protein
MADPFFHDLRFSTRREGAQHITPLWRLKMNQDGEL